MEFQLWNSLYNDTAKYGCPGLIMTGNLKAKVEVALRDPKMKFLIVLKVDAVLQYEWKYLQMYDAFPIHL